MFKFITDTADALVGVTADTLDFAMGDGDGPKREDVSQLVAAGMTVAAIAVAFNMTTDAVESLLDEDKTDE